MSHTALKPKIAPESTITTCADCHKFKPTGEGRGRGECLLFNEMMLSHYVQANDCKLNLASEATARKKTIDSVGQQIQDTRSLLNKTKHRSFLKNQLILKPPF